MRFVPRAQPLPEAPAFYISEFAGDRPGGDQALQRCASRRRSSRSAAASSSRGGQVASLEGDPPHGRFVVIAFDSLEKAQAWYDSPAYRELRPIRHRSATSRVFILEGPPP